MDWNDETIARLRTFWDEGHSTAEIGRRLGITKNAVVGKAHRLSLVARPSPIKRPSTEEKLTRPPVPPRRVSGPTLPASLMPVLQVAAPASGLADRVSERSAVPVRSQAVLRAVPAAPRPAARVSSCCWPIGEPGTPSFRFCSDPALASKPYCSQHAAIAYVKVRDRREDAA